MQNDEKVAVPVTRGIILEVGAALMPVAILGQPVVAAWANQHFGQSEQQPPSPQQQTKDDS
jgi:hypothetical protein